MCPLIFSKKQSEHYIFPSHRNWKTRKKTEQNIPTKKILKNHPTTTRLPLNMHQKQSNKGICKMKLAKPKIRLRPILKLNA